MNTRITLAVVVAFLVYALYSWYSIPQYDGFDINTQKYSEPDLPPQPRPLPLAKERTITPGGPNSPGQKAPNERVIIPEEEAFDPQADSYESAEHPERLRHPERLYGPGLEQDDNVTAVESGIASKSFQQTMNAYQSFGPEFAQNGGAFMENGVVANDTLLNSDYSSV
jgi:hypothetical protein